MRGTITREAVREAILDATDRRLARFGYKKMTIDELAADAGIEDLPTHGGGQQVVARLSAESRAAAGAEVELSLDTSGVMLFATDSGRSLTAA
jgi:hypothetical protein